MIDFTSILLDFDDQPIKDGDAIVTLGKVARNALIATYPDERGEGDEKLKRFLLAAKCSGPGVTLTAEETALAKKLVGKAYGPLVVGRAWALLDPPSVPSSKKETADAA